MRGACIDIGSNTTRLLVADVSDGALDKLQEHRVFTHLRRDVQRHRAIAAGTLSELVDVVAYQLAMARSLGAERITAVGTAAIRRAQNAGELARLLERRCGLTLRVLSEDDEARLAFRGACAALTEARVQSGGALPSAGELGVVDVGGGSSELVVGAAPDRVRWSESCALGSGDLTDACLLSDPPSASELAAARAYVDRVLEGLPVPRPALAVAVGGSAASLRPLAGQRLDGRAFAAALELLLAAPAAQVAHLVGLDVERVRLLPAGVLILQAAQERFGVPLEVVGGGLREGVLIELVRG